LSRLGRRNRIRRGTATERQKRWVVLDRESADELDDFLPIVLELLDELKPYVAAVAFPPLRQRSAKMLPVPSKKEK